LPFKKSYSLSFCQANKNENIKETSKQPELPPGRAYVIGKTAVDLADDFKSRNFEKTVNNVIDRVVPKGLRKIGVPKKSKQFFQLHKPSQEESN
jgi:hypothetical protein